ncbi:MAG: hypothetical protein RR101_15445 [Burkholderiaceae bacterium]
MTNTDAAHFVPTGYSDDAKAKANEAYRQLAADTAPAHLVDLGTAALASIDYLDTIRAIEPGTPLRPETFDDDLLDHLTKVAKAEVSALAKVAILSMTSVLPSHIAPCDYPALLAAAIA